MRRSPIQTGKKDLVWFVRDDARPLFSRRIATTSRGFVVALDRWLRLDETGSGGITMHTLATGEAPRFSGLVRSGVWILATLVPIIFLLRLFALTLYSIPESDDFCFTYSNLTNGFAGTVWSFYQNAIGRIVPLVLMQVPATISGVTGIDYFITYVATLASFEIGFAAAMVFVAFRLWPQGSIPQNVCFAAALAATILSGAPSLREMLYWLPGVACYILPGVIVVLVLVEFVQAAENGTRITPVGTVMLAVGCFVASLCNEFTPPWLIGLVLCSLTVRWIFRHDLQIKEHAIIGGAALIGFVIVLLAPGNGVRMGQLPMAGVFGHSAIEALLYSISNLLRFFAEPATVPWLIFVVLFTVMQPEPVKVSAWNRRLLAVLVPIFSLACGYLAYFIHQYATGIRLAMRAQNEAVILLVFSLTISTVLLARAFREPILGFVARMSGQRESFAGAAIPVVLAAVLILPLYYSKTSRVLRSEQGSFHAFWLESMGRHSRLMLSPERNLVVAKHNVFPTALMGGDMTDDPDRLPNDCIAHYYGKDSVVIEPAAAVTKAR